MKMKKIRKRAKFIFLLFVIWCIIITVYLFNFAIYSRSNYIKKSNNLSLREGLIPTNRGHIYDKNGTLIAWSERYYDLCLKKTSKNNRYKQLIKQIQLQLPNIQLDNNNSNKSYSVIRKMLTPKEIKILENLLSNYSELFIRPNFKRFTSDNVKVTSSIGKAEYINGKWTGINGIEKTYNNYLNGTDGLYSVRIDKKGKWIKGTWTIKKKMEAGKDLYLNKDLEHYKQK